MKTYNLECDCGFMVQSRMKKEVTEIAKTHVRKQHRKKISNSDINKMILTKTEEGIVGI